MRFDRCAICDYVEDEGSTYSNRAPSSRVTVQWSERNNELLCTTCRGSIEKLSNRYSIQPKKNQVNGDKQTC